jgi:DNA polymerase (family 10)
MPASTPRDNAGIAAILSETAQLLELTGADRFRVIAVDRAARVADASHEDLIAIAKEEDGRKRLMALEGIGAKIADKIIEYARTGRVEEHQELLSQVPPGLLELLAIPGLGPKTVKAIWETTGTTDLAGLRKIIADGTIMSVPRMGEKTVRNIAEAIEFSEKASQRIPLGIALPIAEQIVERLSGVKGVDSVAYAGSLRRGRETIGDVDILVCAAKPDAAHKAFTSMPEVEKVLASGETKSSVRLKFGETHLQADLRVVPKASAGAALLYFTGSKEHNVRLRELALKQGMTLNEYGLYPEDDDPTPPQHRKVKPKASATEP